MTYQESGPCVELSAVQHLGMLLNHVEHSSEKFAYLDPAYAAACLALVVKLRAPLELDARNVGVNTTRLNACLDGWSRRVVSSNVVALQQRMAARRIAEGY